MIHGAGGTSPFTFRKYPLYIVNKEGYHVLIMLVRDRSFWAIAILLILATIITYQGEQYIHDHAPDSEWHLTLALVRGLIVMLIIAIAGWRFGFRAGLFTWLVIGVILTPHILIETIRWDEGIPAVVHYVTLLTLGLPILWFTRYRQSIIGVLKENRRELDVILNNTPLIALVVNQGLRVQQINQTGIRFANRPEKEILGLCIGKVLGCINHQDHPDCSFSPSCDACPIRDTVLNSFTTGKTHTKVESTLYLSSREGPSTFLVTTVPVSLQETQQQVLIYIDDITERKRAGEMLKLQADLLDAQSDYVYVHDFEGNFIYVNRMGYVSHGYTREEVMGMPLSRLDDPETAGLIAPRIKDLVDKGQNTFEAYHLHKDGSRIPLEIHSSILEISGLKLVMSVARNITERKQAEEKLKSSEEYFRLIIENISDAIIIADADGAARYVSPSVSSVLGYEPEEIIGRAHFEFIHPEDLPLAYESLKQIANSVIPIGPLEFRVRHKNGLWLNVQGTLTNLINNPSVAGIVAYLRDITERNRAEEALKLAYDFNRTVFNSAKDAISVIDVRDYTVVAANTAYLKQLGLKEEEVIGKPCYQLSHNLTHPCTGADDLCPLQETLISGEYAGSEHKHIINGDRVMYVDVSASPIRNAEGEITQVVHVSRDITERKLAHDALRASEASLREAQRIAHLGNWDLDIINNRLKWSEELFRIFGMDPQTCTPSFESCLSFVHPGDRKRVKKAYKEALQGKKAYSIEYRILRRDGSELTVHDKSEVIADEAGRPVRMFGTIYDLTERKKMEEKLVLTDRLASIGEMASGVAHEMNNPLTSVIGFSELLLSQDAPEAIKEDLRIINKEAQRTVQIVKNLLRFARKYTPRKEPVNVNSILEMVLEIRAYEQKAHNIEVVRRFSPDLPAIMADGFQLQQVFLNIVINAEYFMIEAHKRGTFIITTEAAGDMVRISFADDGPGISAEHLGHIFDPFFTTKMVGKGTGLGLSICYGTVTEHGGRIHAESEPGKGATFIIELPVIAVDQEEKKPQEEAVILKQ